MIRFDERVVNPRPESAIPPVDGHGPPNQMCSAFEFGDYRGFRRDEPYAEFVTVEYGSRLLLGVLQQSLYFFDHDVTFMGFAGSSNPGLC